MNGVNIKGAGNLTFQSASYSNSDNWGYYFDTWTIDKNKFTIQLKKIYHSADGGEAFYRKWIKEPALIVTMS